MYFHNASPTYLLLVDMFARKYESTTCKAIDSESCVVEREQRKLVLALEFSSYTRCQLFDGVICIYKHVIVASF